MATTRWIGLDVHARETACALLDQATGEVETRKLSGRPEAALAWLERLERPFVAVYEAGPTGYGLARAAAARGFDVRVCSPGGTANRPSDRIKTDTRDALRLARLLAAGELRTVRVPTPARSSCAISCARVKQCASTSHECATGSASCCCAAASTTAPVAGPGRASTSRGCAH